MLAWPCGRPSGVAMHPAKHARTATLTLTCNRSLAKPYDTVCSHPGQSAGRNGSPTAARREPTAILIDPATLPQGAPPPPTVEQNMAFAAFQQERQEQQQQEQQQRGGADMDVS
ncbi:hypothetical protein NUW54_g14107 [Trametes sanguinea]|uniref:Uncharacterized protein n=1 Tax=Trametes sanguinea TaxID=158606 RepID=A0ACC1MFK5_9APHY|nr:hypothetical protein NUW54_g14107 [Trametes sanguinea]